MGECSEDGAWWVFGAGVSVLSPYLGEEPLFPPSPALAPSFPDCSRASWQQVSRRTPGMQASQGSVGFLGPSSPHGVWAWAQVLCGVGRGVPLHVPAILTLLTPLAEWPALSPVPSIDVSATGERHRKADPPCWAPAPGLAVVGPGGAWALGADWGTVGLCFPASWDLPGGTSLWDSVR